MQFVSLSGIYEDYYLSDSYYETILTEKALRDEESVEMLEIVINNFVIESCDLYQWGTLDTLVRNGMKNGNEFATILASNTSAFEAAMQKTVEAIHSRINYKKGRRQPSF